MEPDKSQTEKKSCCNMVCAKECKWLSIWVKPRAVFEKINQEGNWKHFWKIALVYLVVLCVYTLCMAHFGKAADGDHDKYQMMLESFSSIVMIAMALLLFLVTLAMWTINAACLMMTGRWLGGRASYLKNALVVAVSTIPYVEMMLLEALLVTLATWLGVSAIVGMVSLFAFLANVYVFVFTIVAISKGLAVINDYPSAWRGFGNYLLGFVFFALIFIVLGVISAMIIPSFIH